MLKIKDNVDLRFLEDYRFDEYGACYMRTSFIYGNIYIDKDTREITRLHPFDSREIPNEDEIEDLIKADLVENID